MKQWLVRFGKCSGWSGAGNEAVAGQVREMQWLVREMKQWLVRFGKCSGWSGAGNDAVAGHVREMKQWLFRCGK
ncbi:hypothetical protein J6590_037520 [Homalodisca vitripennis]|nr:hypothetical protein J6590_037520 [Homalodisca vitripennis]